MKGFFQAIASFFKSLFGKSNTEKPQKNEGPDTEEIARKFYSDMVDSEAKRKR